MKCPKCREGDLFLTPTFSFQKPTEMPKKCPVCEQNYMPEPGFWYGAMFISYIWTAWACIFFLGGGILLLGMGINAAFALYVAQLKEKMEQDTSIQFVDVRTSLEYSKGYIKPAVNIDYRRKNLGEKINSFDKEKPLYLYLSEWK